jgi:adenine/guanine phosphoribosyltransferase-like PRPP-binding protein
MLTEVGFASLHHPPLVETGRYTVHAHVESDQGNVLPKADAAAEAGSSTIDQTVDKVAGFAKDGIARAVDAARRLRN